MLRTRRNPRSCPAAPCQGSGQLSDLGPPVGSVRAAVRRPHGFLGHRMRRSAIPLRLSCCQGSGYGRSGGRRPRSRRRERVLWFSNVRGAQAERGSCCRRAGGCAQVPAALLPPLAGLPLADADSGGEGPPLASDSRQWLQASKAQLSLVGVSGPRQSPASRHHHLCGRPGGRVSSGCRGEDGCPPGPVAAPHAADELLAKGGAAELDEPAQQGGGRPALQGREVPR